MDGLTLNSIGDILTVWLLKIGAAALIFVVGMWLAKRLTRLAESMLQRSKLDETLIRFAGKILFAVLVTFVAIAALSQIGVQTASLIAVLGAAGLAVGLALQGSLSNFAAGVMIIGFRPFQKGDYVEAAGVSGSVDEVSIFTTTLLTPDNRKVIVPNAQITGDTITNYSAMPTRRLDLVFGIGYNDDMTKAKNVLENILKAENRVLKDPAPNIAVHELGDSSVNLICRPWVKKEDYWNLHWDLHETVKQAFDKEGISIPFPQRDMHIHNVESLSATKAASETKASAAKSSTTKKKTATKTSASKKAA